MKYFILVLIIAAACGKRQQPIVELKPEPKKITPKEFFKAEIPAPKKTFLPHKKPIALVYHANINTIFHCSAVNYSDCGLTAVCGDDRLVCLKNTKVEYLR